MRSLLLITVFLAGCHDKAAEGKSQNSEERVEVLRDSGERRELVGPSKVKGEGYDGGSYVYSYDEYSDEFLFYEKNEDDVKHGVQLRVKNATLRLGNHRQFHFKRYINGDITFEEASGEILIPE